MKRQIRRNVFETNSSSVHSISISRSGTIESSILSVNEDTNKIGVHFGEFGWGYDKLNCQSEKLSYLLTMIAETETRKLEDFYNSKGFIKLNAEISQYCNCDGIEILDNMEINDWNGGKYLDIDGYIDHQSSEDYSSLSDFLEQNNTNIIDYVFNNGVSMIIDNDNR